MLTVVVVILPLLRFGIGNRAIAAELCLSSLATGVAEFHWSVPLLNLNLRSGATTR